MRSFLATVLKGTIATIIGTVLVYGLLIWFMTGKNPGNVKNLKSMVTDASNIRTNIQKIYSRNYEIADQIQDDSATNAAANKAMNDALNQVNAKANENAVALVADASNATITNEFAQEIRQLKVKLAHQQAQLDRVENQNRILILQFKERFKDSKIKDR